ncbi:hypothetical protein BaRGS_00021874 [Batillaria attramentaria]|uniref:Uncharacterized protein n=1 Tax=Batillaria attramentaria TaxID=370345 RepID=A0ABD0KIT8_9CAEN
MALQTFLPAVVFVAIIEASDKVMLTDKTISCRKRVYEGMEFHKASPLSDSWAKCPKGFTGYARWKCLGSQFDPDGPDISDCAPAFPKCPRTESLVRRVLDERHEEYVRIPRKVHPDNSATTAGPQTKNLEPKTASLQTTQTPQTGEIKPKSRDLHSEIMTPGFQISSQPLNITGAETFTHYPFQEVSAENDIFYCLPFADTFACLLSNDTKCKDKDTNYSRMVQRLSNASLSMISEQLQTIRNIWNMKLRSALLVNLMKVFAQFANSLPDRLNTSNPSSTCKLTLTAGMFVVERFALEAAKTLGKGASFLTRDKRVSIKCMNFDPVQDHDTAYVFESEDSVTVKTGKESKNTTSKFDGGDSLHATKSFPNVKTNSRNTTSEESREKNLPRSVQKSSVLLPLNNLKAIMNMTSTDRFQKRHSVPVVFLTFRNYANCLPFEFHNLTTSGNQTLVDQETISHAINSHILTVSVVGDSPTKLTSLTEPLVLTFSHLNTEGGLHPECVFLDMALDQPVWSRQGCELRSTNRTHSVCTCDHLSSFAVVARPSQMDCPKTRTENLKIVTYVLSGVSVTCNLLVELIFCLQTHPLKLTQRIQRHIAGSLLAGEVMFMWGTFSGGPGVEAGTLCTIIAGPAHYFFLIVCMWTAFECVYIFLLVVKKWREMTVGFPIVCAINYGVPAVIVALAAGLVITCLFLMNTIVLLQI